jgi:hypothetical protein
VSPDLAALRAEVYWVQLVVLGTCAGLLISLVVWAALRMAEPRRRRPEPAEGSAPAAPGVPWLVWAVIAAALIFGVVYTWRAAVAPPGWW